MNSGSCLNLLGLVQGWQFQEKKGSAFFNLFSQLQSSGDMCEIADFEIPKAIRKACFLKNFSLDKRRWNAQDQLDVDRYKLASIFAHNAVKKASSNFNAILQIGSNYSIADFSYLREKDVPLFSFHDNNFASYSRSLDPGLLNKKVLRKAYEYESRVYDSLSAIFTMSKTLRRSFIEDFGLSEDKVIYAGFGTPFAPKDIQANKYNKKNILFIATHSFEAKGGRDLLTAFKKARKVHPSLTLTMIGKDWGVDQPGVNCIGFLDKRNPVDLKAYQQCFEAASLFVLPSYNEAFGEVFVEAMSYGLPCIGTKRGVMPELLEENGTGYVVEPGDVNALTDLIINLLGSKDELMKLGMSGVDVVSNEYQWSTVTTRVKNVIGKFI